MSVETSRRNIFAIFAFIGGFIICWWLILAQEAQKQAQAAEARKLVQVEDDRKRNQQIEEKAALERKQAQEKQAAEERRKQQLKDLLAEERKAKEELRKAFSKVEASLQEGIDQLEEKAKHARALARQARANQIAWLKKFIRDNEATARLMYARGYPQLAATQMEVAKNYRKELVDAEAQAKAEGPLWPLNR